MTVSEINKDIKLEDFRVGLEIETTYNDTCYYGCSEDLDPCNDCCTQCEGCSVIHEDFDAYVIRIARLCKYCRRRAKSEKCYEKVKTLIIEKVKEILPYISFNDEKKEITFNRKRLMEDEVIFENDFNLVIKAVIYRNNRDTVKVKLNNYKYICFICLTLNGGTMCCGNNPVCCSEIEECERCRRCDNGYEICRDCDNYNEGSCGDCSNYKCLTTDISFNKKFIDYAYHDGSCGLEFPTKAYKLPTFIDYLKKFYEKCRIKRYLRPPAGGHLNISIDAKYDPETVFMNYYKLISEYIDIVGILMRKDTYERRDDEYRRFQLEDMNEKYSLIRIRTSKFEGFEIRWCDIYPDFESEVAVILFNVALLKKAVKLALNNIELKIDEEKLREARNKYKEFCSGINGVKADGIIERFAKDFAEEIKEIKEKLNIDLIELIKKRQEMKMNGSPY